MKIHRTQVLFLVVSLAFLMAPSLASANQRGGLPALAERVETLEAKNANLEARLATLEGKHDADIADLERIHPRWTFEKKLEDWGITDIKPGQK